MRKILNVLIIGLMHFAVSKFIPPVVRTIMASTAYDHPAIKLLSGVLVTLTKILYFPILTLSLYPRHLFPGYWINGAIFLNSLLWGAILYGSVWLCKKSVNRT